MAYNRSVQVMDFAGLDLETPKPRVCCPYYSAFGKKNCVNCHFGGSFIAYQINSFLEQLIVRERNNKKIEYLSDEGGL